MKPSNDIHDAGHPAKAGRVAEALKSRGRVCLRVFGTSMLPWVRPGDRLLIERTELSCISVGDIILFAQDTRLFVHRVIRKRAAGAPALVTKGDAVDHLDAPVSRAELLGRVSCVLRGQREIHLGSPQQLRLGRLLARVSPSSRHWFPLACATKRLLRALRRFPGQPAADTLPARETRGS